MLVLLAVVGLLLLLLLPPIMVVLVTARLEHLLLQHFHVEFKHRIRGRPPQPQGKAGQGELGARSHHVHASRDCTVDALDHVTSLEAVGEG